MTARNEKERELRDLSTALSGSGRRILFRSIAVSVVAFVLVGGWWIVVARSVGELERERIRLEEVTIPSLERRAENLRARLDTARVGLDAAVEGMADSVQQIPDAIAAARTATRSALETGLRGFMWIGNYGSGGWSRANLQVRGSGAVLQTSPNEMAPGDEYVVRANLVLRDGLPSNDADYFRARASLGVATNGTTVRLESEPVPFDREFAVQYWAEVSMAAPGDVGWVVVLGGDRTLEAARDEARAVRALGLAPIIVLRHGSYRTVVPHTERAGAVGDSAIGFTHREDVYIVDAAAWCPRRTDEGAYFECSRQ